MLMAGSRSLPSTTMTHPSFVRARSRDKLSNQVALTNSLPVVLHPSRNRVCYRFPCLSDHGLVARRASLAERSHLVSDLVTHCPTP